MGAYDRSRELVIDPVVLPYSTYNTADLGGNISATGGAYVTERGIYWSTTSGFTPPGQGTKVSESGSWETGTFTAAVTGLPGGTNIYFQAFATNTGGTGYTSEATFTTGAPVVPTVTTTAVSGITSTTASGGGNVTDNGGTAVTARGVCWSTSDNPTISGRITDGTTGIQGVTLTFSNSGGSTVTLADGTYSHTVNYGWSGTVTPSKTGYTFSPANYSYSNLTSNLTNRDFTASLIGLTISGKVTVSGTGLAGVTLAFSNQGAGTTTTASDGTYSHTVAYGWSGSVTRSTPSGIIGLADVSLDFSGISDPAVTDQDGYYAHSVPKGWSGSITPEHYGYVFFPTSQYYTGVISDMPDQNFTSIPTDFSLRLECKRIVTGSLIIKKHFAELRLTLERTGDIPPGWSGSAAASNPGYGFSPSSLSYENVTAHLVNRDYIASPVLPFISGRIAAASGRGIGDVFLVFSNNGGSAATNAHGIYIHYIPPGWWGTVTPSKTSYTFSPGSLEYANVTGSRSQQDFLAVEHLPRISGKVTESTPGGSRGLAGVTLTWKPIVYTEDSGGYHVLYSTVPGGPYQSAGTTEDKTITELEVKDLTESTNYYFVVRSWTAPHGSNRSRVESVDSVEIPAATRGTTISGYVKTAEGQGVHGVEIMASNRGGKAYTDSKGNYNLSVTPGWSGTVTPAKQGFDFSPSSLQYSDVDTDRDGQDYTAEANTKISGQVTDSSGAGVPDVGVTFTDNGGKLTGTTTTDADGNYLYTVAYNWAGTAVPAKTGYKFEPAEIEFTGVAGAEPGKGYKALMLPAIEGRVKTRGRRAMTDVNLTFTDRKKTPEGSFTLPVDENGNYSKIFTNDWSGSVKPVKPGYRFYPKNRKKRLMTVPRKKRSV